MDAVMNNLGKAALRGRGYRLWNACSERERKAEPAAPVAASATAQAVPDDYQATVHELRAPLAVVNGYVAMLREGSFGPAPAAWQAPLEVVAAKAEEASALVEDLLLLTRLDSGTMTERLEDVDLGEVVAAAVARASSRAALLRGRVVAGPGVSVRTRADRRHLDRILDNLINNALVHGGEHPTVEVSVGATPTPRIHVADDGPGVPEEMRERIFERYVRADESVKGSGLGLHICRRLAARMGAQVTLERQAAARGAVFSVTFP